MKSILFSIILFSFFACSSDENGTAPKSEDSKINLSSSAEDDTKVSSATDDKKSSSSQKEDNHPVSSSSIEDDVPSSSSMETPLESDTFVDERDGHVYKMTKIGSQIWMAEHLKYVPTMENSLGLGEVSLCIDYKDENCEKHGRYYQWATAMGVDRYDFAAYENKLEEPYQGLCPNGWHIPSGFEFKDLMTFLNGDYNAIMDTSLLGTDTYGFSLTNTGRFGPDDSDEYTSYLHFEKNYVYLWSVTGNGWQKYSFYIVNLVNENNSISRTIGIRLTDPYSYMPVRCIKDSQ